MSRLANWRRHEDQAEAEIRPSLTVARFQVVALVPVLSTVGHEACRFAIEGDFSSHDDDRIDRRIRGENICGQRFGRDEQSESIPSTGKALDALTHLTHRPQGMNFAIALDFDEHLDPSTR